MVEYYQESRLEDQMASEDLEKDYDNIMIFENEKNCD